MYLKYRTSPQSQSSRTIPHCGSEERIHLYLDKPHDIIAQRESEGGRVGEREERRNATPIPPKPNLTVGARWRWETRETRDHGTPPIP